MGSRHDDGSADDANYGAIEGFIRKALGDARSVLNVGAGSGAGSYEPIDRNVTAVEPSASMRGQRPPHLPVAIDPVAQSLPFADQNFDAIMSTFSVHQWPDLKAGLAEMRRVTRGVVLIVTCDPARLSGSWLAEYAPELIAVEARRYPAIQAIVEGLGGQAHVEPVEIPLN